MKYCLPVHYREVVGNYRVIHGQKQASWGQLKKQANFGTLLHHDTKTLKLSMYVPFSTLYIIYYVHELTGDQYIRWLIFTYIDVYSMWWNTHLLLQQGLRLREAQRKEKDFRVELKKCRADLEIAQVLYCKIWDATCMRECLYAHVSLYALIPYTIAQVMVCPAAMAKGY